MSAPLAELMDLGSDRGVSLWVEVDGPADGRVVLMSQRLGAPADEWPDELVDAIIDAGYRAVRYDYRDCGRSSRAEAEYTMYDLALDAVALLDRLGVDDAHILGHSMGGTVSAIFAIEHPERTRSYTVINGGGADPSIPEWTDDFAAVAAGSPGRTPESWTEHLLRELRVMSVEPFDAGRARARAARMVELGWAPRSIRRMLEGTQKAKPPPEHWRSIDAPTLVIHGTEDRVLILPHGRAIADAIDGARLVVMDGMGHDLQPPFRPDVCDAVVDHLRAVDADG
ncbi:MAG: alpha/beta hydrolase [Acidimicrobiales bacterium]|nr:alpha/beta hydrolase [Acidimicrobiales bacterium]